jgi:hypothetical protein
MNLHVAAVCSATTLNAQYETKGTIIRVLKPRLNEKQVRKYRQGVTFLVGSLCCFCKRGIVLKNSTWDAFDTPLSTVYSTHIVQFSPNLNSRLRVDHNRYLVDCEISFFVYLISIVLFGWRTFSSASARTSQIALPMSVAKISHDVMSEMCVCLHVKCLCFSQTYPNS